MIPNLTNTNEKFCNKIILKKDEFFPIHIFFSQICRNLIGFNTLFDGIKLVLKNLEDLK